MMNVGNIRIDAAKLQKMATDARPKAGKIVRQYGLLITGSAMKRAPRDTGNLMNSIGAESKLITPLTYRIQDGTNYGVFLELGHITRLFEGNYNVRRFVPARPFMRPALEEFRQRFINAFEELFKA